MKTTWPSWMVYTSPSTQILNAGAASGAKNVVRDASREVLAAISGLTLLGPEGGLVWRGQADQSWPLNSKSKRLNLSPTQTSSHEKRMIAAARRVGADNAQHLGDFEILGRLRHHGAATRLIDFTTDPMVALWFLCSDSSQNDSASASKVSGVLLALQRDALRVVSESYSANNYDEVIKSSENQTFQIPPIDPRIAAQRGIFVFAPPNSPNIGVPTELTLGDKNLNLWKQNASERLSKVCGSFDLANQPGPLIKVFPQMLGINIHPAVKALLKKVLATSYGFTQTSMFPDFSGLGQAFADGLDDSE